MEYYTWKSIDAHRAARAIKNGAEIWELPIIFGNGAARFTHGLQTKRGARFVVSSFVMRTVEEILREQAPEASVTL